MTRYHLRYQVFPGQDPAELAAFCLERGVEEVVLMFGAEELHAGHTVGVGEDLWFETVRDARDVLHGEGISVSLNPWVTVGHGDRGREEDLGFAPLVSPTGEVSTAAASLACPVFQQWLAGHYGRFAEIGFRVMWLEDDFRFHNHAPLTWGGGFEPEMLERFALLAGEKPSREELVAAVTAPGEPHPWRALLQQTWREAQLEVVSLVRQAVAGRAKLGLMSSGLGIASVEGRRWDLLFDQVEVHRPHFAFYGDTPGQNLAYSFGMLELQRALRPAGVEVAPEVENWTHTEWRKSDTQTWSEMVTAHLSGASSLLLDVFPFVTGSPGRYPRIGRMLTASRPALDATVTPSLVTHGVGIPWWQDAAASVQGDGTLDGLDTSPLRAAEFLLSYGVPIQAGVAPVTALFGEVAWAVPDPLELLRGSVLLDGTAASILALRGFGSLLGVEVVEVVGRSEVSRQPYSLERVCDGGALLSVNVQPAVARLVADPAAEVWTEILTPRGEHWGAGRVGFVNALGGRVFTMAATAPEKLGRCDDGQRLAQEAVRFLGGVLPMVTGGPHLIPQYARVGDRWRLAIANGSADPAHITITLPTPSETLLGTPAPSETFSGALTPSESPTLSGSLTSLRSVTPMGADVPLGPSAMLLVPLKVPQPVGVRCEGGRLTVEAEVPHRGFVLVDWT
ncbi:hypothetical protein ACIBG8_49745 [Nonomuraea sp. NPDC050556]|uniref:hypothetical protein n=1 Tax=Nonomuraea sp. NPDC050556 TaxID=3364369 RepID=UPI003787817E